MNDGNIKLSILFEDVVSSFIKRHPGLHADFAIENRLTVQGDYIAWRDTVQSLIEYMIGLSSRASFPAIAFGHIGTENIYVVMDNGGQFSVRPGDTLITISVQKQLSPTMNDLKRIVIKQGSGIWDLTHTNVDGIFSFSFN